MNGYGGGGGRGSGRRGPGDRGPGSRDSGRGGYGDQGRSGQRQGGPGYDVRGQARPQARQDDPRQAWQDDPRQPWWDDPRQQSQRGSRPGQGAGQAPGRGQGYGQPGGRPDPWPQPQRPGAGTGPQQYPRGYDPRVAASRRAADGYPPDGYQTRDAQYGQEGHAGREPDQRHGSFLPGFGGQDDYDERAPRRGRGGRYPDEAGGYGDEEHADRRGPRAQRDRRGRAGRDPDKDGWDEGGQRRPRRGLVRRLAPWVALLVILTPLVAGGVYVYNKYESRYHPADYSGPGTGTVTVQVDKGDTAFSLGPRLVSLGVVASARAFELAAEASMNTTGLEAGFYTLHRQMKASLAWAALLNPKNRVQSVVTIPEGKRVSQVIAILAKQTKIPLANFQQVINHPAQLGLPPYANGKVEGYLFPATYAIQPHETALQILQAMVQRFDVEAQAVHLQTAAASVHLTPGQLIIEASLAQAEGGSVSDYPKIALVINNRLKRGMLLQFDSTVLYGLGKYGVRATFAETQTPGPYNSYLNHGLPPGPICNPGDAAIQAILHPATGNLLYFITSPSGKATFSATPLNGQ